MFFCESIFCTYVFCSTEHLFMHTFVCSCVFDQGRTCIAGLRSLLPIFQSGQPSNTSILPSLAPPHPPSSMPSVSHSFSCSSPLSPSLCTQACCKYSLVQIKTYRHTPRYTLMHTALGVILEQTQPCLPARSPLPYVN